MTMDSEALSRLTIRPATPDDAVHMVDLVDMAGDGLPMATWSAMAGPGEDARLIGMMRARRDTGGFSWRHAWMAEVAGQVAGMVIFYPLPAEPVSLDGIPPLARPLQELENFCPAHVYINAVAVYPDCRGRGIGRRLLDHAGPGPSCLIAGSGNAGAMRLYQAAGFAEVARRAAIGNDVWSPPHAEWVLMRR